jgi:hypothetical protein
MSMGRLLAISVILGVCVGAQAASTNTNTLAIFLVKEGGGRDEKTIKLAEKPLISGRDFVRYDWSSHTFAVTAECAKRMAVEFQPRDNPRRLKSGENVYVLDPNTTSGRDFAVVAEGEIVYVGKFWSLVSSSSPPPVPLIQFYKLVPVDGSDPVEMQIEYGFSDGKADGGKRDVRKDRRVGRALERLGGVMIPGEVVPKRVQPAR